MTNKTLTFYDALDVFSEHIEEIKHACMENISAIIAEEGTGNGWVRDEIIKLRVAPLHNTLKRIVSRQQARLTKRGDSITDDMIARAKEFPIEEMYDGRLRKGCGLCPFHQEKTPSFQVKKNKFNCYGCGEHGDAIDFYMKVNNCNFITAVKAMQ